MFARFRDENALMDPGSGMPGTVHVRAGSAEPDSGKPDQDVFHTLMLESGRRLAWAEFGHRHGYPILYMHRQGGSRLEALFLHDAAEAAGFRLISVDRPGLGGSDFFAFDDPAALAEDYIQLMDQLNLPQVAVLSWGGGSRFALALASQFPSRVSFLNLLSPLERGCALAKNRVFGFVFRSAVRMMLTLRSVRVAKDESRYLRRWREQVCYADRKLMDDPKVSSLLARIARESISQGAAGLAQDIWIGLAASGVDLSVLPMPVHVWNGSADTISRPKAVGADEESLNCAGTTSGIVRHWVHRQGHLFFSHAAGDIFSVARRIVGISLGGVYPLHR
ncbi:MAG: alpha/beta hydrolase [Pseudohongiella sp.]|nr:alpha/beta hydrolase [Pseudohongiella sp.]MDP2126234.1 alpha/beta hydrolase [Pseudohongiella sp.]